MTIGRELKLGELSSSDVYAILSRRKETVLRVSLIREFAEEICDYDSRYIAECFLEVK